METFENIHIFKTNICTNDDLAAIRELLNGDSAIEEWSVDTEDEDKVLRIVSKHLNTYQIINLVNSKGYLCCELA